MLSFKIIGLEALAGKLSKDTVAKPLAEGIKKIVVALEGEVKKSTPVDTGLLRSEMFSSYGETSGMVGSPKQYAPFVEYGTQFMEPRHVTEGSSTRVLGEGMFSYGLKKLKEKLGDLLKGIAFDIERKWGD